jgi:C4-dicarboxylate-specific signal transduction histidine kinase
MILLLLASLARFAIQPVMRVIEQRVVERTGQLQTVNNHLEREIAERELAEHRTRELLDQLAHASRLNSLGQMAAGLAHELNQPVGAVVNYAEAAQCHLESNCRQLSEARNILRKISGAGMRAGKIVRRLRGFIRKEKHAREQVVICALINEVIELCEPEARKRQVRIEFETASETASLPKLAVDAIQIQQVLVNLIQNAMQAMEENPAEDRLVRLVLGIESDDELRIDVIDGGCGFDNQQAESLFAPFFTTRNEGLGMGLAICRSIVQEHAGRFWATSRQTGGSIFSFTLPLVIEHEPADCLHC